MPAIFFKKQLLGQWRRDDGESITHVTEDAMFQEMTKLAGNGWNIVPHGVTYNRGYEVTKQTIGNK